jgi:hypothetical protein
VLDANTTLAYAGDAPPGYVACAALDACNRVPPWAPLQGSEKITVYSACRERLRMEIADRYTRATG